MRKLWFFIRYTPFVLLIYPAILAGKLAGYWGEAYRYGKQAALTRGDEIASEAWHLFEKSR